MENFDRKNHWENIYQTKGQREVSWYQAKPETSLNFIINSGMPLTAKIIDIGGGDGFLVDCLLESGYTDITVLDISAAAIEKAKLRLGNKANDVKWIISDITDFKPAEKYDVWHDRAVFHFLLDDNDTETYTKIVSENMNQDGVLIVGTFSEQGPKKCSGIEIKQYSEAGLTTQFERDFTKTASLTENHKTPFDTFQHFVFCVFRKRN
jgi:trans-aconitate methyltransferase